MTVGQLTRLLQNHPQDMRVVVDGYEDGYDDLTPKQLRVVKLSLNTGTREYVGAQTATLTTCRKRNWRASTWKKPWHCTARPTDRMPQMKRRD